MAEEFDESQEKTEEATPHKREEAKQHAQVVRSRELCTFAILLTGALGIVALGPSFVDTLMSTVKLAFSPPRAALFDDQVILNIFSYIFTSISIGLFPFILLILVITIFSNILVGGWVFSFDAISFNGKKLNPIAGIKKMFSIRSLVELFKSLGKFLLISIFSVVLLWHQIDDLFALSKMGIASAMQNATSIVCWTFVGLVLSLIVIVIIDVPFQIWSHLKQMKMTKQEVKDEVRNSEGKPEIKAKIRRTQNEISRRRMMNAVPKADVIITNPSHFAVALRYDDHKKGAPRVVAKGVDLLAQQIIMVAKHNHVPLFSAPSLARAIYFSTKLNREIPAGLYVAVAKVLAYVYQLKRYVPGRSPKPKRPNDFPIPPKMRLE